MKKVLTNNPKKQILTVAFKKKKNNLKAETEKLCYVECRLSLSSALLRGWQRLIFHICGSPRPVDHHPADQKAANNEDDVSAQVQAQTGNLAVGGFDQVQRSLGNGVFGSLSHSLSFNTRAS